MVNDFLKGIIRKKNTTVKAEVDPSLQVSAWGGLAIVDHLCQRIGLWKQATALLPERVKKRGYSTTAVVSSVVHGLLQGGRGFHAAQALRHDVAAQRMLGLMDGMPEEATVNRAMCNLAALNYRKEQDTYERRPETASMLSDDKAIKRRGQRIVGDPEPADRQHLGKVEKLLRWQAAKLLPGLPRQATHIGPFLALFGDATQLEVTGRCFDAAEWDNNNNRSLQYLTLWAGPLVVAGAVRGGARDEADLRTMLDPVDREVVQKIGSRSRDALLLADCAQSEENTLKEVERLKWRYVIGLPTNSAVVRQAQEQPASQWIDTGAQPRYGWSASAVCAMNYMAESWSRARTVIVRRFMRENEFVEQYRFVVTDLEPADVKSLCNKWKCSYQEAVWRLYDHKQARENQFKTPLSDLGLHHPPSGRLGLNQVFYLIAAIATNLAMALSWRAVAEEHRGMRLWRIRTWYFAVAAAVRRHAGSVCVRATGALSEQMQAAWLGAFTRISEVW